MTDNIITDNVVLPDNHFRTRVFNQYGNIPMAILRELIQNSQDALSTIIDLYLYNGEYGAQDNGIGMDYSQFKDHYLTLGGSNKPSGSTGCFGAAKELLSYAWGLHIAKGLDFESAGRFAGKVTTNMGATRTKGFFVGAQDPWFGAGDMETQLCYLVGKSDLSIKVRLTNDRLEKYTVKCGRKLRKNQHIASFEFGNLYVHKGKLNDYESTGMLYTRTNGIFTCEDYVGGDYVYYLNITKPSNEVLSESREALKPDAKYQVQQELSFLTSNASRIERKPKPKTFKVYGNYAQFKRQDQESSGHQAHSGSIQDRVTTSAVFTQEAGSYEVSLENDQVWRLPCAVVGSGKGVFRNGQLTKKYQAMLECWTRVLNQISDVIGIDRFLPGFYLEKTDVNAMHCTLGDVESIVIRPERLQEDSPFALLELAIHEIAHHYRECHSQEYEQERMTISRRVGPVALALLHNIEKMQATF
jgi:hypothetical protein